MLWPRRTPSGQQLTVCSAPSRRVASLRPRYAGLAALTAFPRTVATTWRLTNGGSRRQAQMLWWMSCLEFRVLQWPSTVWEFPAVSVYERLATNPGADFV